MQNQTKLKPYNRKRITLRKLILTGSIMAQNQKQGIAIDSALAENWHALLKQCREEGQFN